MVEVESRPVEAGSFAENFHPRNLLFRGGSQALQVFAWNQVAAAIAQFENEQVQSRSRPIFHFCHPRLAWQLPGVLDGAIDLGVGSHDLMSDDLMLCHVSPPTTPRVPQSAGPQHSKSSSHRTAWHWRARKSRSVSLMRRAPPAHA